jgi:hypothetical protein
MHGIKCDEGLRLVREGVDGRFRLHLMLVDRTAGPSTALRSGRDDNSVTGRGYFHLHFLLVE